MGRRRPRRTLRPPWPCREGKYPFIMQAEGHGAALRPGRVDGPFPEHYEPAETPVDVASLLEAASQPVHEDGPERHGCSGQAGRPALPHRSHDLRGHRAVVRRRRYAQHAGPARSRTAALCGDEPRTGQRRRASRTATRWWWRARGAKWRPSQWLRSA